MRILKKIAAQIKYVALEIQNDIRLRYETTYQLEKEIQKAGVIV